MGNLFYRGVSPGEIESMSFHRARYWSKWHDFLADAERQAIAEQKTGKKTGRTGRKSKRMKKRHG